MKVFYWEEISRNNAVFGDFFENCKESSIKQRFLQGSALAVGGFDGCHLGHQAIFSRIFAQKEMLKGVVTFVKPPRALKEGEKFSGCICTLPQQIEFFDSIGLDFVLLIDFSLDFGRMKGEIFLQFLYDFCKMRFLTVGSDFRCGYKLDTGCAEIADFASRKNVKTDFVDAVCNDSVRVSSSLIRKAVCSGDFNTAKKLLGRAFVLDVRNCEQSFGDENEIILKADKAFSQIMPPVGQYTVCIEALFCDSSREPEKRSFSGIVKVNPTFLSCRFSFSGVCLKVQTIKFEEM